MLALKGHALIELCCSLTSELAALGQAHGMLVQRVAEAERFDLPRGLSLSLAFIGANPVADAWAALPCTAWCTWQFINAAKLGPAFVSRLAWRRRHSIRMVGHAEQCLERAIAGGGGGHFEWPRFCRGWQRPRVRRLVARLKLLVADFEGCAVGVEAAPGLLAK